MGNNEADDVQTIEQNKTVQGVMYILTHPYIGRGECQGVMYILTHPYIGRGECHICSLLTHPFNPFACIHRLKAVPLK